MSEHPLEPIFHPRGIALVGVPSEPTGQGGGGGGFLNSIMEQGYHERAGLYPVNPKATEIAGLKCYASLTDIEGPVDHVISLVPARVVPVLVEQAVAKGVRSVHFFTAGFSETGDPEMAQMERAMVKRLTDAGIRVIGPNCMGLYVPGVGLAFMGGFPTEPGNVMLISQSGANAGDVVHNLSRRGARFSKVISFGNGSDLRAHDFLDYAITDDQTEVVTAYIEGVQDGRKFFEAVKRLAAVKPTVLLKGGLTGAGARAAHSHTGSLAGSTQIFDAMCRQTGAFRAETMEDLHDITVALTTGLRRVRGRDVALVGGGGGFAVLSSDALAREGLDLPPAPQAVKDQLSEFIPVAGTSVNNPFDTNMSTPELSLRALRIVASGPYDMVIAAPSFDRSWRTGDEVVDDETKRARQLEAATQAAEQFAQLQQETGVPFIALMRDRGASVEVADRFAQEAYKRGVAVYPTVARAARAVSGLLAWRERRVGLPEVV
ncbi:MAG: CoA-binding protein [Chloroflexi bacterium]|nr:CoA-binding protein [Chloroflexota bacterium]MDA1239824.1 CoA-binding protein [Chloroflexota bacterium]